MEEEEWPIKCPECKSKDIDHENKGEYTGGGFGDSWSEFWCNKCGHEWRFGQKHGYY
jgi:transposase-like protein